MLSCSLASPAYQIFYPLAPRRYAVIANTGQHEGLEAPPVLLPSSLDGAAGGEQPLAGKTAGICWKVGRSSRSFHFKVQQVGLLAAMH